MNGLFSFCIQKYKWWMVSPFRDAHVSTSHRIFRLGCLVSTSAVWECRTVSIQHNKKKHSEEQKEKCQLVTIVLTVIWCILIRMFIRVKSRHPPSKFIWQFITLINKKFHFGIQLQCNLSAKNHWYCKQIIFSLDQNFDFNYLLRKSLPFSWYSWSSSIVIIGIFRYIAL